MTDEDAPPITPCKPSCSPSPSLEIGKIHQGDCIELMQQIDTGTIDLVFADPPFNIGYEYDEYHDRQEDEEYIAWSRAVDGRGPPRPQAGRHVLAGDRRRVRGRAEGRRGAQDRLHDAQLGRLVLHVRRQLHEEVLALARALVPLREGREQLHVQRRGPERARAVGAGAGVRRQAGEPERPAAGRHLDSAAAGFAGRLRPDGRHRGTSPAWPARSRSGRAFTAARCRSSCWAGSSA